MPKEKRDRAKYQKDQEDYKKQEIVQEKTKKKLKGIFNFLNQMKSKRVNQERKIKKKKLQILKS